MKRANIVVQKFRDAPIQIIDGDRGKNYPIDSELLDEGYCLFLNTGNVTENGFNFSNRQFISFDKDQILRKGKLRRDDLVMTTRGTVGNVSYYNNKVPFENIRINSGMVIFRVDQEEIIPSFLYQYIRSSYFNKQVNALRTGAAQPQLPIRDIKCIKIQIPQIAEQEKIADVLSAYDDLIDTNRRRIQLLEKAARLLFREWFVYFRFPGHEKVKIVDGVPAGWIKGLLGDSAIVKKGRNITFKHAVEGDIPVVGGGLEPTYYHNKANVSAPVITISASGANAGYVNMYDTDIWASDCSYIDKSSTKYIYSLYLRLKSLQTTILGFQVGVAQPHVYPRDLNRLKLLMAPDDLCLQFEQLVTPIFNLIKNLKVGNQKLVQARDLLLPRLMSGEIEV